MRVRIGIDVGGTFTDAIAINNDTLEIIGFVKVLTTHHSKDGVASGIIDAIFKLISTYNINIGDINIIATGTTQATNALLEGDVACVGVILVSSHNTFRLHDIRLSGQKYIPIKIYHIKPNEHFDVNLKNIFDRVVHDKIKTVVASCSFSPDNPIFEKKIVHMANQYNLFSCATYEISQLYGFKIRTNTAIINASLLPKMVTTFEIIEHSIRKMGILAPIMIMRCDGGIMSLNEIKKRPFLTILSGPCASVYGALIHEKISNGIFLEVGGTSSDISVIQNGNIAKKHAQIGKHTLYLNSLDIHTLGVAGGSMVKISYGKKLDIGPRSAHIAGLRYSCFCNPLELENVCLTFVEIDGSYYIGVKNSNGETFAITLTCVLNALSLIDSSDYSYGIRESARAALAPLAKIFKTDIDSMAYKILDMAISKCLLILNPLIKQYNLDLENLTLFGGGGGCGSLVPFVAKRLNCRYTMCKNANIISTIGVCLSTLREVVEKTLFNPSQEDIKNLKLNAIAKLSQSMVNPDLIETCVEFDNTKNLVRVIASGSIDLSSHNKTQTLSTNDLIDIVSCYINCQNSDIILKGEIGKHLILEALSTKKILFGLLSKKTLLSIVIDNNGIIKFCKPIKEIFICTNLELTKAFFDIIKKHSIYTDAGCLPPKCIFILPNKTVDLSTFLDAKQMLSIIKNEMEFNSSFNIAILIF